MKTSWMYCRWEDGCINSNRPLWNSWKEDWKESMDLAEYVLDIETNMQRVGKENTPSIE